MRQRTIIQVWSAILIVAEVAIFLLVPGKYAIAPMIVAAAAIALLAIYVALSWRRLARYLRRLEDYTASLPMNKFDLPDDLPDEFAMLSSALQRTSNHVGAVIDRANLELSRRETILAGMAEGVLAVDEHLHVTFCNEAFFESFHARRPLPEGRPLYEVVREPLLRAMLESVVETGKPLKQRLHLHSASGKWFQVYALPLDPSAGVGAIAVLHDVTELQRQEQARKDFVANVSHELRTPLAAIRGYAETLLDGALEDANNNRRFVEVIQSHAIRLNNIASDLLVLSGLDAKSASAAPEPIPVQEIFEAALRTVESTAAIQQVALRVSNSCEVVLGYRLRLEQILVNLMDNAVKFNKPGGSVTVECTTVGSQIRITVADTGIGIPSEDLKRIFERFYRVDRARSRQVGGTGLGLSIVKESLERMSGSVTVESQWGQGTRFAICLPAASTTPEQHIEESEDREPAHSGD